MKKKADDNVRQQLLDKLSEESIMVLETAYVYAKPMFCTEQILQKHGLPRHNRHIY